METTIKWWPVRHDDLNALEPWTPGTMRTEHGDVVAFTTLAAAQKYSDERNLPLDIVPQ